MHSQWQAVCRIEWIGVSARAKISLPMPGFGFAPETAGDRHALVDQREGEPAAVEELPHGVELEVGQTGDDRRTSSAI
jgi:hypothetical protein